MPRLEDFLVRKEAAEDCGTFAFRDAAEKDRNQPIPCDQPMQCVDHQARSPAASRSSMRVELRRKGLHLVAHLDQLAMAQLVELFVQRHDVDLRLEVDLVVVSRIDAIALRLPVLRHHDHRRLQRCDHRQDQIEENEGVGIELVAAEQQRVACGPRDEKDDERQDEGPGAADLGDLVGDPVTEIATGRIDDVGVDRHRRAIDSALQDALFDIAQCARVSLQQARCKFGDGLLHGFGSLPWNAWRRI